MPLGLGSNLIKTGMPVVSHVTSNLKMLHRYNAGSVVPVSDGAAYFDGTDDYIDANHNCPTGNYTVAGWIMNVGTTDGYYAMYSGGVELWLGIHALDGHILLHGGAIGQYIKTGDSLISKNKWHYIVGTWDGSNAKIYLDGVLCSTTATGTFQNAASTSVDIGNRSDNNSNDFNGYICNVAVWTDALTQPQIKSIMFKKYADLTTGTGSESENLVSWWNMDEGTGTSVEDSHGSNDGSGTFA